MNVLSVSHRSDPIILGCLPGKPPNDNTFFRSFLRAAFIWNELERVGLPGITGVWSHEAGGGRMFNVVSIRQLYPGITPVTNTLEFRSGGVATIRYVLDDGFARELNTTPSGFGSNRATFVIPISPKALALFKAVFGGTTANGAISIVYQVSVDSRLPAVEVTVKFDSATAYEYQVRKTIQT